MIDPTADIELWLVDLDACAAALEQLEREVPRLDSDDRERADAIVDLRERRRRLAAYTALRILVERVAGLGARRRPFVRDAGTKPRLGDGSVEFNLSHAEGLALIAVSRRFPVGVDLEKVRPATMSARRLGEIVAIGAGLGERPLADLSPERTFFQAWARLEAFAKARGRGLAQTLTDLGLRGKGRLQLPPVQIEAAARRLVHATGLAVRDVQLPSAFHGAVAASRPARVTRARSFPARLEDIAALAEET